MASQFDHDSELLAAYGQTVWTVSTRNGERRFRLGAGALSDPALMPAGIITAYNPRSRRLSAAENAARDETLTRELGRTGYSLFRTLATDPDPDSKWDEPGFAAVGAPLDELVEIAGRFDQNAIVWIDSQGDAGLVVTRQGFCGASTGQRLPL